MTEDYTPIYTGDTQVPFAPVFQHADGTPVNINGATFAMKMVDQYGNTKTCSGTWAIDDPTNGKAHYNWQTADVNSAGMWTLYITITIGGAPVHADTKLLQILTAP